MLKQGGSTQSPGFSPSAEATGEIKFKSQWFGEALATPAYPLNSREETIFEALGGPLSCSFGADADIAAADLNGSPHEGGTRKSTAPPEMRPEVVRSPRVQYVQ
jgi:hypothetical protein